MNWYKEGYGDEDEINEIISRDGFPEKGEIQAITINKKTKMKTLSKVKNVQGNGSFESQYGAEQPDGKKLLFVYDYEFEDGIMLKANHKITPGPFNIGDEVEYEVTRELEQYGKSGKVKRIPDIDTQTSRQSNTNQTGYKKYQKTEEEKEFDMIKQIYIVRQSSLNRAIEYLSVNEPQQNLTKENVTKLADYFANWVMS